MIYFFIVKITIYPGWCVRWKFSNSESPFSLPTIFSNSFMMIFFFFYFVCMSIFACMYVCVPHACSTMRASGQMKLKLQRVISLLRVRVLRLEPWSSGRTVSALNWF